MQVDGGDNQEKLIWSATPTPFWKTAHWTVAASSDSSNMPHSAGRIGAFCRRHLRRRGLYARSTTHGTGPVGQTGPGDAPHGRARVSDTSAARVTENIRSMTDAGADGGHRPAVSGCRFLQSRLSAPLFFGTDRDGPATRRHLRPTAVEQDGVGPALVGRGDRHPRVKFVKDSSGSVDYRRHLLNVKTRRPDLTLLTGLSSTSSPG